MARDFPGTNGNYLSVANPSGALDVAGAGAAFTLAAWFKADTLSAASHVIVGKLTDWASGCQYLIGVNSGGQVIVAQGWSSGFFNMNGPGLATGTWYHVAYRSDGAQTKGFLNGAAFSTGAAPGGVQDTAYDFRVGNDHSNSRPFDGQVAEVALWNVALTDAQVAALAAGAPVLKVAPFGLGFYAPLWGADGLSAGEPDLSGGAKSLSRVGSVGVSNHAPVAGLR